MPFTPEFPTGRRRIMRGLLALLLVAVAAAPTAPAALVAQGASAPKPTGEAWQLIAPPQSSLVFARDGSLIGEIGREWRTSVSITTLPKYLPQAFIAVEDHRFYQHDGVDVVGIAGAIKDNILGGSRGASTITQQLVGNMHPDLVDRRDKSISRKLREQSAARQMEKHYSKAQILEAYLNQINFGHGWYGIESAARHYFGKAASQLSLAEAASLAALPKGPAIYDPSKYPDRNRNRRDAILALMVGQKFIKSGDAAVAKGQSVATVANGGMSAPSPYFVDVVKSQVEKAGVQLMQGGYRIYTTIDPGLQRAATVALIEGTAAIEARPNYKNQTYSNHPPGKTDYLQGAVVAIATIRNRRSIVSRAECASQGRVSSHSYMHGRCSIRCRRMRSSLIRRSRYPTTVSATDRATTTMSFSATSRCGQRLRVRETRSLCNSGSRAAPIR
jgi:membrane peptidoglycan carboxypeptidase